MNFETPFDLARHIRCRISEIFQGKDLRYIDLGDWFLEEAEEEFLPKNYPLADPMEADVYFYRDLLQGWLLDVAKSLDRAYPGNFISPLLKDWDEILRALLKTRLHE